MNTNGREINREWIRLRKAFLLRPLFPETMADKTARQAAKEKTNRSPEPRKLSGEHSPG